MTSYRSVGATVLVLAVVTLGACSSTVETEGPGASSAAATGSSAEAETPADSLSPKAFPEDDEPVAVEAGTYLVSGRCRVATRLWRATPSRCRTGGRATRRGPEEG